MDREWIHHWIFKGLLGLLALAAGLTLVRQLGFYDVGHINKVVMPIVLLGCGFHITDRLLREPSSIRLDPFFLFLLLLALFGILQGGLALALGASPYGLRQFVPHAFVAISAAVIYLSFSNYDGDFSAFYDFAKLISPLILATFVVAMGLFYFILLPLGGFYLGFASEALLVPLALAMVSRRYFLAAITIALILLSGKRGILLAAPVMVVLELYLSKVRTARLLSLIATALIVVVLAIAAAFVVQNLNINLPFSDKILLAITAASQLDDPHALAVATSGRSIELSRAAELLTQSHAWLTGMGFGFGFFFPNVTGEYILYQHYVHVTPFNYVLQNGALLAAGMYTALGVVFARAMRRARRDGVLAQRFLLLLVGGNVVVSLTAFIAGSDPLYWVLLGLMAAIAGRQESMWRSHSAPDVAFGGTLAERER